jgi:hypothetical protein
MEFVYGAGLLAALVSGGAAGWLGTILHSEHVSTRERGYELELTEAEELLVARAALRRRRSLPPDNAS